MNKIGILGSGIVGRTLAAGFVKHGYEVMIGSRTPEKLSEFKAQHSSVLTGTFDEAAGFGEVLVLAVKGGAAKHVLEELDWHLINNKIMIDTTNPIADSAPKNGVLKFTTSLDFSLMEMLQQSFPEVRFVKAFNSIGNAFMVNPQFKDGKPSMFICGNDEEAKAWTSKMLETFGFVVEDMGKAESARAIEPLCMLWCIPGFIKNEWSHAFKLLKI